MEEAAFEGAVKFALKALQKSELALSSQQKEALWSVITGKDTFVSLPTGHGKSVIFECLPLCCDYLEGRSVPSSVLVVSPLVALMESQVDDLRRRGQSAARLTQSMNRSSDFDEAVRYVFAAPEGLDEPSGKALLLEGKYSDRLRAIFFDEAHCVEAWGSGKNPFRQQYSKLANIHSFIPSSVPFVALTATATVDSRTEICKSLEMVDPIVISVSPNRLNLRYSVFDVSEDIELRFTWLLEELHCNQAATAKTIVFCRSVASCSQLYSFFDFHLKVDGYVTKIARLENALFGMYHAKITDVEKSTLMQSFSEASGSCRVLFSTIAFGMGINIPDIRRVIHNGPADSIETYVQESGRGGRDGHMCEVVLYTYAGASRGQVSTGMKEYCSNTEKCRRILLMNPFPGHISLTEPKHMCCDICTQQCLCSCTCKKCNCHQLSAPCISCCTCTTKCTFLSPFAIVMPTCLIHADDEPA